MLLAMADRRANVGIMYYCLLVSTLTVMSTIGAQPPINNQLLGVQYISYTNFEGTIATGDCCDEPGKTAGACTPDLCDTAFLTCATSVSKCDLAPPQSTPATFNTNNIIFGQHIGNGVNKSTSFLVLKFPFIKHNITFSVQILETPEAGQTGNKQNIADLQFVVDWVDPVYRNPPHYRRFVLNDTSAQLVVDVVSQCSKYYFTQDCSVFCQPDKVHYTCLDNGTMQCLPGWSGSNCLTMIDYCPGNTCQHGSTCKPVLLNYTCDCTSDFEGHYCETAITTVAPGVTSIPTTPSTTTTTNAPTLTTTVTNSTNQGKSVQSSDSDDDSVAPLAAGVTVGLLALLTLVAATVYYVIKRKNEQSQVKPNKKRSMKEEEEKVSTPKSDRTVTDVNGIQFNNEIKPKEEILRSLDAW